MDATSESTKVTTGSFSSIRTVVKGTDYSVSSEFPHSSLGELEQVT